MLTYHMTKLYLNIKSIKSFNFWNSSPLTISQICYMFIPCVYISYISSWTLSICRAEFLSLHFCICTNPSLVKLLSRVWLFATLWTVAHQAPPSMECSRQEYWSELPFPSPGESSRPGDQTPVFRITGRCFTIWATRESQSDQDLLTELYLIGL